MTENPESINETPEWMWSHWATLFLCILILALCLVVFMYIPQQLKDSNDLTLCRNDLASRYYCTFTQDNQTKVASWDGASTKIFNTSADEVDTVLSKYGLNSSLCFTQKIIQENICPYQIPHPIFQIFQQQNCGVLNG